MFIPKRFKLAEAASDKARPETGMHLNVVHIIKGALLASNGVGAAMVPIVGSDKVAREDLPHWEVGEDTYSGLVPLRAIKEATRGKTGVGRLAISEFSTEAQGDAGKPWIRVDNPAPDGQVPNFDWAMNQCGTEAPESHRYIEVSLDAQLLAGIASAIGAEEAVQLRFLVNKETGIADAAGDAHGSVSVRPVREKDGGRGVLMIHVVDS